MNVINKDLNQYLKSTEIIDYGAANIQELTSEFELKNLEEIELIKVVYEYVRDNISHSFDIDGTHVTCKASEVLKHREGICYAKSHLLAALLRGLGIPTGICYQRLILSDEKAPYLILHGLNAVYVSSEKRWIRIDPRGNKEGVDAQFSLVNEQLAFEVRKDKGEEDILEIFEEPDPNVVDTLNTCKTVEDLYHNLPKDISREE